MESTRIGLASLWSDLDPTTREAAARCIYSKQWDDAGARRAANRAIAATLRFREVAVQQLPVERRVAFLARRVVADDTLAYSLLMALHLGERREMLAAFLDALEIPQRDGLIDDGYELHPVADAALRTAVDGLYARFPEANVTLYLCCLQAMDPEIWGGLDTLIRRAEATSGPSAAER
jgi:hypothetical protein